MGTLPATPLASHEGFLEIYQSLGTPELVALHAVATVVVATLVLGLLPLYGPESVKFARRWTVSSTLLGIPLTAGLVTAIWFGLILSESGLWFVIGVPMVIAGLIFLPSWIAIGFVAAGRAIAVRFGVDQLWVAVILAGVIGGLVPLHPIAGAILLGVLASLGVGSGSRTLFRYIFSGLSEERVTPPSSKV